MKGYICIDGLESIIRDFGPARVVTKILMGTEARALRE